MEAGDETTSDEIELVEVQELRAYLLLKKFFSGAEWHFRIRCEQPSCIMDKKGYKIHFQAPFLPFISFVLIILMFPFSV